MITLFTPATGFPDLEAKIAYGLARELESKGVGVKVKEFSRGTLHCMIKGVRVSFFEYLYPLLLPLVPCDVFGCLAAPLEDIACMKFVAIAQRGGGVCHRLCRKILGFCNSLLSG